MPIYKKGLGKKIQGQNNLKTEIGLYTNIKLEILTKVVATNLQKRDWHEKALQYVDKETLDKNVSILQFIPVDKNNKVYKDMMSS